MDDLTRSLSELWSDWAPIIQSDGALFIYSWSGISGLLLVSAFAARRFLKILKAFNEANLVRNFKGRKPSNPDAITKRIIELRNYSSSTITHVTWRSIGLLIVGMVVPGVTLGLIVIYQHFLLPGEPALIWSDVPPTNTSPSVSEVALFIADQAMRGGLSDTFEVFGVGVTSLTNNTDNAFFSAFVLIYRMIAGIVAATTLYLIYRIIKGMNHLKEAISILEEELAARTADNPT